MENIEAQGFAGDISDLGAILEKMRDIGISWKVELDAANKKINELNEENRQLKGSLENAQNFRQELPTLKASIIADVKKIIEENSKTVRNSVENNAIPILSTKITDNKTEISKITEIITPDYLKKAINEPLTQKIDAAKQDILKNELFLEAIKNVLRSVLQEELVSVKESFPKVAREENPVEEVSKEAENYPQINEDTTNAGYRYLTQCTPGFGNEESQCGDNENSAGNGGTLDEGDDI